jgi:hypothetical protein
MGRRGHNKELDEALADIVPKTQEEPPAQTGTAPLDDDQETPLDPVEDSNPKRKTFHAIITIS